MSAEAAISIKDQLKNATLPEDIVPIVLDRKPVAEFKRLEIELQRAQEASVRDKRMAGRAREIAEQIEALREQMFASTVNFCLRGFSKNDWNALKEKHPVKDDANQTDVDQLLGADAKALFNEAVRLSIVSPQLDDEDWVNLVAVLSDGEWDRFVNSVYAMNEDGISVPFSRKASAALRPIADD